VYESAAQARLRRAKLAGEVISDLAAVHEAIAGLAAECTEEVLTSHPGGARPPEVLHESLPRTLELLSRGISMRTLYQHSARFDRATAAHVECMTESGAQVRTLADGFAQIIVFDKRKALMPLHDDDHGAVLVRDLSVVDFAVAAFERSWSVASPFSVAYSRKMVAETSEDVKLSIMRLLADGEEDRKIAARVGVSLRSYQRHVSEIMKRLGARTRLHAGYLIREHGLLEEHPAHSDCP
jgi:DNA-binding CsgD family transcriptional regulator